MKKIFKNFNNLVKKTIFKVQNKTNNKLKISNFNNIVKKTVFNVQKKTNNKLKISNFNKFLIGFIGLLFLYIFYLLIPISYDKEWIKKSIESKLLNEFRINLSSSGDISYRILPAPHFLIKDSKILSHNSKDQESIADIKNLKIFLNQNNFFDKKEMDIKNITINRANFSLLRRDLKILKDANNSQFSHKEIKINKSNIFFKDNLDEIILIVTIDEATLFFDDKQLSNIFSVKANAFAIPFTLELKSKNDLTKKKEMSFEAKSLNLDIFNESIEKKNNLNTGKNIISFLNTTVNTKYDVRDKTITFKSYNPKMLSSKIDYNGELSINPFDLNLDLNLKNYKVFKLFDFNPILIEFLKSGLLFNDNISLNTSIIIKSNKREIINNAEIFLSVLNGKINLDNTRLINDNIGLLELDNSNLYVENNKLILNTDIFFEIKNSESLFSFLNTRKKLRKDIRNILINLNYDFLNNEIKFNSVKIDNNEVSDQFLNVIEGFNDNNSNNLNKSRRLLNKLLNIYEG